LTGFLPNMMADTGLTDDDDSDLDADVTTARTAPAWVTDCERMALDRCASV
jgi:hypothetical protein